MNYRWLVIGLFFINSGSGYAQTAEELNQQAMQALVTGDLKLAIDGFNKAIDMDSAYVKAYINLGFIYYSNGLMDDAVALYTKALQFEPQNPMAHNNLGAAYIALGKHNEAILEYKVAIKLYPDYAEAHNNLAYAYYSLGLYKRAIAEAKTALKLNPQYAMAYNYLGISYHAQAQYDSAEINFRKSLEIKPDFVVAMNNLGTTLRFQGKTDESVATHQQAAKLDSTNIESFNGQGIAYLSKGETQTAIASFEKVLQIMPRDPVAHNNLSYCYYDQLDYALAMQHAKAAERYGLKINPDYMKDLEKSLDPKYLRARHILVKTQSEAEEILKELNGGANFVELSAKRSLDPATARKGGDFGYFQKGDLNAEFENVISSLKVGDISAILKTAQGYHIFQRLN